jgi:hypothetical protein
MAKPYSFTVKTPQGDYTAEADTWDSLVTTLLFTASGIIAASTIPHPPDDLLEANAKTVLDAYLRRFVRQNNRLRSPIAEAGLELDLIKCYLSGMTSAETVSWFQQHKNLKTSKTSVGRYWKKLSLLGVAHKSMFVKLKSSD